MPKQHTHPLPITAEMMDEAVREFARGTGDDNGETAEEISERLGQSLYKTRKMLRALAKSGRLVVGRGVRKNIAGVERAWPVYFAR